MKKSKTFYIESLGCAKNQVDSEIIISKLLSNNWIICDNPDDADLIVVNTCGFITPAKEESIDTIIEYRDAFPEKKILMAGCLSQRYGSELAEEFREVDGFFGNSHFEKIPEVALSVLMGKREKMLLKPDYEWVRTYAGFERRDKILSPAGSAYIKISEGCDNRCTFCAIPIIRGRLRSRPISSVIEEFKYLLSRNIFEINLIAQDLASFGMDRGGRSEFLELLREISAIEGDFWVRLLYFHPDNFDREIVNIIKDDPRILPYFDLPFQHASKKVLRKMGRRGSSEEYLELIRYLRESLPDVVIRSTFLVGFPGEGSRDFDELLDFQGRARLDWVGVFSYSEEEGTAAFDFDGKVSERVSEERKRILEETQVPITEERMERFLNRTMDLLVEEDLGEGTFIGRGYHQAPEVDGIVVLNAKESDVKGISVGDVVRAKIVDLSGFDLSAVV